MEILGLSPVAVAVGITFVGIILRTIIGMGGKSYSEFEWRHIGVSFIIGFFASVQLVIVAVQTLPANASELVQLAFVTGQIALVMGIDSAVKGGHKAIVRKAQQKKLSLENPIPVSEELTPSLTDDDLEDLDRIDVPEELPPERVES